MPKNARKVLLITARADHGGGPRHILDLLAAFKNREIRFVVAAPEQEPYAPLFRERCERFVAIPARLFSIASFFRLAALIRKENIDIIHSHGRGAGPYSRLLGLVTGRRVLHTFHGIHNAPGVGGRFKLLIDQVLAFFPFHAIFSSEMERARAERFRVIRWQRFSIVANAVDLSRFRLSSVERARVVGPTLRVGAFLRPDFAKGPDRWLTLVGAAKADPQLESHVFSCVGISEVSMAAFGKGGELVEINGPVANPVPWLEKLDVFVSTSRTEGLPLGVLEALAAGIPCLLANIPAHEIFFRRGFATPFDAEDPQSFVEALKAILARTDEARARSVAARRWIEREFSLERFHERLLRVYDPAQVTRQPRILIFKLGALGDLFYSLPAVFAIRRAFPHARIEWLVSSAFKSVLGIFPFIDQVISIETTDIFTGSKLEKARAVISARGAISSKYDAILLLQRHPAYLTILAGKGPVYQLLRHEPNFLQRLFLKGFYLVPPLSLHESAAIRRVTDQLLRSLGAAPSEVWQIEYAEPPPSLSSSDLARRETDSGPIIMHLGGGENFKTEFRLKQWPKWMELTRSLLEKRREKIIFVGGPNETELAEQIMRELEPGPRVLNLAGKTKLPELVREICRARVFVGPDSGPLHIADQLGIPSVGVYGPTSAVSWGLLAPDSRAVFHKVPCQPCYRDDGIFPPCPNEHICMTGLSVEAVERAVLDVLESETN